MKVTGLIGRKCLVKTDYMDEAMEGVITRVRVEVKTADGNYTLVSAKKLSKTLVIEKKGKGKK